MEVRAVIAEVACGCLCELMGSGEVSYKARACRAGAGLGCMKDTGFQLWQVCFQRCIDEEQTQALSQSVSM